MCWAGVGLAAQQTRCLSCGRANWCVWLCGPLQVMARPGLCDDSALGCPSSFTNDTVHPEHCARCKGSTWVPVFRSLTFTLHLGSSCFGDGSLQPSGHLAADAGWPQGLPPHRAFCCQRTLTALYLMLSQQH